MTAGTPLRVFLSHTFDLGTPGEAASFVAAAVEAVLRARHSVTDMAYFAAPDTSPAGGNLLRNGSPVHERFDVSALAGRFAVGSASASATTTRARSPTSRL
jgi:hypothetical protein